MDTAEAISIFRTKLDEVEAVEEGIYRGYKRYHDAPYAVFYVDATGNLTERADALPKFQDRILGPRYFQNTGDLRWNSYLLFLIDQARLKEPDVQQARVKLESDRNYARKFVVTPEELVARIVDGRTAEVQTRATPVDVVSEWERVLIPVGLHGVFDESDIASIVRSIGTKVRTSPPKQGAKRGETDVALSSRPLLKLRLEEFRKYPKQRDFDFGLVTLICGVNGVGKTTLLEGVEYFYCGQTRRCIAPSRARVSAMLQGEAKFRMTSARSAERTFRDREFDWYGKLTLRGNKLAESFSVYNFLNTDAAVHLMLESNPQEREQDLASLLVGADARVSGGESNA